MGLISIFLVVTWILLDPCADSPEDDLMQSDSRNLERHLHRLRGLALGLKAGQEAQEPKRSLVEACGEFLDLYRPSAGRKVKTYQAYRVALEHFQESCPKPESKLEIAAISEDGIS